MPIWGTGSPRREFLHVDDLADATVFLMRHRPGDVVLNVRVGADVSILEPARLVADVIDWHGRFAHDLSKPDGVSRKLADLRRLTALGRTARILLCEWIEPTVRYSLAGLASGRVRLG